MDEREAFARYLKPRLFERLTAIGLDVVYHRGAGDYLYYRDASGREVEVLDMLGGFGASLFGHNHPELVMRARAVLDEGRPFNAQASVRGAAGRLAQALSERIGRSTGRSYVVTLANSGTEATEAALKHAEMEAHERNRARLAALDEQIRHARLALRDGTIKAAAAEATERALAAARTRAEVALAEKPRFLALEGAFHGKTTGSLKLTFNEEYRSPWARIGIEAQFVPVDDAAALDAAMDAARVSWPTVVLHGGRIDVGSTSVVNVSGLLVEPIQGEGGIRLVPDEVLRRLRGAADSGGFPLILDEIQTGMGRTGDFLASQRSGVRGDYYLLSKALGGGLAEISALLVDRERALDEFGYLHTSTFADDDFSSEVALAALSLLDRFDGALQRACRERGAYLVERLAQLRKRFPAQLAEVRGRGLMVGVELAPQEGSRSALLRVLSQQGLLGFFACGYLLHQHQVRVAPTLSSHGTLRLEPSAYISVAALDRFCDALEGLAVALRDADTPSLVRGMVGP